jgi:hypothetical protein
MWHPADIYSAIIMIGAIVTIWAGVAWLLIGWIVGLGPE